MRSGIELEAARGHEVVAGICGICPAGCGVNVHLAEGRIERLTPLAGHPQGILCPRGQAAPEIVYSPDRILFPQKRVGPRGSGDFARISWDEAYAIMVERLRALAAVYGPETACIYTGRGNFEYALNDAFAPAGTVESSANAVLFPFGSPNTTGVGSLCYVSYGMIAARSCFGDYMCNMMEDVTQADLILVWGENPRTDSSPINLTHLVAARKRRARIIVIDHRHNETAKATRAEWIGVRPGTDGALALALMHVLIAENLFDREFVAEWTYGFDALRAYVQSFTPERAETITGVSAARIRRLAREIAAARGCAIMTYTGLEYSNSGVQAIRAVWILQALAGHLDTPGGKVFRMRGRPRPARITTPVPAQARPPIGHDAFPLYHEVRREAHASRLPAAILENDPYPIRAMIISGSSVITSWPDPELWRRALAALEFLVVVNRFPTADSEYADLILPATTGFEIASYMVYDDYVQLRQQIIPPLGEARNDYLIFAELAARLGYGHLWPQTEEALIDGALADLGVTQETLRRHPEGLPLAMPEMVHRKYARGLLRGDGQPGFSTPTGKFEIASEWLRAYGYDPLPVYTEPLEGPLAAPEMATDYPLVLNTGTRTMYSFRSQHHNIPSLAAREPWPIVTLHPEDARARGIEEGDEVDVVSPRGRIRMKASVTQDIVRGAVEANMGGGGPLGPAAWRQANVNALTDLENQDPISGFPVYKALLCDVVRIEPQESDIRHVVP